MGPANTEKCLYSNDFHRFYGSGCLVGRPVLYGFDTTLVSSAFRRGLAVQTIEIVPLSYSLVLILSDSVRLFGNVP